MRECGDERDTYIKDRAREQATDREEEGEREREMIVCLPSVQSESVRWNCRRKK